MDGRETADATWYPLTAGATLHPGAVVPTVLLGERLVVWRGEDGAARVWSDRCPHRGMRLSFGAVQRDTLLCPYHGWTFDGAGQCSHIPAHPGLKPARAARVRAFGAVEVHGLVWGCLEPAGAAAPPWPFAGANAMVPLRAMHVPLPLAAAAAALPAALAGEGEAVAATTDAGLPIVPLSAAPDDGALLLQPMDGASCMAHLVAPATLGAAARLDLSRRLVAARRRLGGAPPRHRGARQPEHAAIA
ncbi:Rieske 2Fe-2S domain-containing protein [Azospirillum sp. ST 5-10]|uniref:Rieske 2Fe-2S domain-containing protein n=1 Tax=unclassified Azospirillum TaxID=2630922 RepID=UPI003F4A5BA7